MSLISLVIVLIVALVLIWAVRTLMSAFGIGDPIATVVYVLIVLVFILWFVGQLGLIGSAPLHLR